MSPIYTCPPPDPAPTQTDPLASAGRPDLGPTSAHLGRPLVDRRFSVSFRAITPHFPPARPSSYDLRPSSHHRPRQPFQCRQFTLQFGFVMGSSFTLNVHPTSKLGESYIGIRQCPHLREIPENCPKMARDRFLIIVPDLIYISIELNRIPASYTRTTWYIPEL